MKVVLKECFLSYYLLKCSYQNIILPKVHTSIDIQYIHIFIRIIYVLYIIYHKIQDETFKI